MRNKNVKKSYLVTNTETVQGESIEEKVRRITQEKSPIKDGAPIIYTNKADGVLPAYDIRTDRWEIATEAYDKMEKERAAKRNSPKEPVKEESGETKLDPTKNN